MGVPGFVGFVTLDEGVVALPSATESPTTCGRYSSEDVLRQPDAQGKGVGGTLIAHLKEHLGESGVNTIYLLTHRGTPAEGFNRKNGYTVNPEDIVMTLEW